MVFATSHLGVDFDRIDSTPAFREGSEAFASNAHEYLYVMAAADLLPGQIVDVSEPDYQALGADGYWYAPNFNIKSGQYFWAQQISIDIRLPKLPEGQAYIVDNGGIYLVDESGAFLYATF